MSTSEGAETWKLVLAYDGADFHGWQVQPNRITVQGELGAAIERITGERVLPQGSGRTDAGVHAAAQVASFCLTAPIPEENFVRALNRTLPASIRVRSAERAPEGFHARRSATAKTYEYRIYRGEICPPWLARYTYAFSGALDVAAMRRAAQRVLGERDFTSFAASDPDRLRRLAAEPAAGAAGADERPRGNVRTLYSSEWVETAAAEAGLWRLNLAGSGAGFAPAANANFLLYRVRGNGFLHHMVRNLVGTFLEVGRGKRDEEEISAILAARRRSSAGATAPARGLFLSSVEYSP